MTRREFIATTAAATVSAGAAVPTKPVLCVFSKPLDGSTTDEIGKAIRDAKADGVDLTVRPKGHVDPSRAAQDLPRAVDGFKSLGLVVPMITTGLTSPTDPNAEGILATAARMKIPLFKLGYWMWGNGDVDRRLAEVRSNLEGLVGIAKRHGVAAGFHNHSGDYVGEAIWDIRELFRGIDPQSAGYYFDAAHATVEGGLGGREISTRIVSKRLRMVAVKDFYWQKQARGWEPRWCPLGEGMVDWKAVFRALAAMRFTGPVSLHVEYEPPDAPAAIARDMEFIRKQVAAAYGV